MPDSIIMSDFDHFYSIFSGTPLTEAFKCYQCDDCKSVNATTSTKSGCECCLKADNEVQGKLVKTIRQCMPSEEACDTTKAAADQINEAWKKAGIDARTDVYCCKGDLCNAGTSVQLSFLLASTLLVVNCARVLLN